MRDEKAPYVEFMNAIDIKLGQLLADTDNEIDAGWMIQELLAKYLGLFGEAAIDHVMTGCADGERFDLLCNPAFHDWAWEQTVGPILRDGWRILCRELEAGPSLLFGNG